MAYAFMYLYRRGQGLSANQATFIQDILQREEASKGKEARQHLQFVLATTDQLDDVLAALSFLKTAPAVESYDLAPQPGELIGRRRNGLDRNTLRIDCRRSFEE